MNFFENKASYQEISVKTLILEDSDVQRARFRLLASIIQRSFKRLALEYVIKVKGLLEMFEGRSIKYQQG